MKTYNLQKTFYKVADFLSWQKSGKLILSPKFQRREVWQPGAKSYLIDSIVRGLPIPIIFLRDHRTALDDFEPSREVIDGQQRLRTVISYIAPKFLKDYNPDKDSFKVQKSHNEEIAGKSFEELDDEIKQQILDYEFNVHILPARVDDREVIQIFRRLNSINYPLKKQELRNANYYGEFKSSAYLLASEQLPRWRSWKIFNENDISRMGEVEFTSECMIMILEAGISGKSGVKIDKTYDKYDEEYIYRNEVENRFRAVLDIIDEHFSEIKPKLIFFKKTLIYTFFAVIYEMIFGFDNSLNKRLKPVSLSSAQVSTIKFVSDKIRHKKVPELIQDSIQRRTTNPKERKHLFVYLLNSIRDAK